jgi:hypothetical protein
MADKKPMPPAPKGAPKSGSGKPDPSGKGKPEMDKAGKAPAKAPVKKGSGKYC